MGLFDQYEPSSSFACPVCGVSQREWQGKDGPCGLFLFREGIDGAVDQRVADECRLSDAELAAVQLPGEFFIYAHDCACPFPKELRCTSSHGVWQHSVLFTGSSADQKQRGPERREQWQARRKWLQSRIV